MAYLKKTEKLEPGTVYFADMKVNIAEFNEKQGEFQQALAVEMRKKGHKIIITRVVPIFNTLGDWQECEWHETGIITGVRMYFKINPIVETIIIVSAVIALAALAVGLSIKFIGIGIAAILEAAGKALEPVTKLEFLIPVLIGIALIGYFFILKKKG
jgi:hypothetical protein